MKDIFLHMHMGLGHHLVLNGLVRKISQNNPDKKIFLSTRDSIHKNIELFYSDNENIIPTKIPFFPKQEESYRLDDRNSPWITSAQTYARMNDLDLIIVGYYNYFHSNPWDYNFYNAMNMDYNTKYEYFKIPENILEGSSLKFKNDILPVIGDKEYVFVHDDPTRNYIIPQFETNKVILKNTDSLFKDSNIFNMIPVLKNASELRMIGSSLICLCDLLGLPIDNNQKCYYYTMRGIGTWNNIQKWTLI